MNWHRLAEVFGMRPPEPTDDRSTKAQRLARLEVEVHDVETKIAAIDRQSRVGSYSRVSIGPRR